MLANTFALRRYASRVVESISQASQGGRIWRRIRCGIDSASQCMPARIESTSTRSSDARKSRNGALCFRRGSVGHR